MYFVVVHGVQSLALGTSTSGERTQHLDGQIQALGDLAVAVVHEFKSQIVDGSRAEHLRVADLKTVLGLARVITLRGQRKLADSTVLGLALPELIAGSQRVVRG